MDGEERRRASRAFDELELDYCSRASHCQSKATGAMDWAVPPIPSSLELKLIGEERGRRQHDLVSTCMERMYVQPISVQKSQLGV